MRWRTCTPVATFVAVLSLVAVTACGSSSRSAAKPSKETFCTLLVAFRASNDSLSADVGSGDPATTQSAVNRLVDQAQTLQQRAPADIAPDVATTVSFLTQLRSLLAQFSYDLDKLQADPSAVERFSALNTAEVQKSLDQLRAYGDTDCAVSAASSTSSSVGSG
jgi:hypothetical protein